jgi:hypothetical protein
MSGYSIWAPYVGSGAIILAIVLLIIAGIIAFLGTRLHRTIGVEKPGGVVSIFLVTIWIISLAVLEWAIATYSVTLYQQVGKIALPTNPITPITLTSGLVTFSIIIFLNRHHGWRTALVSAIVCTAAAPMIFELPFDLIIMWRLTPPEPANLYRFLYFLPLFLVEISTFSLLTLSPLTKLSKYTLYSLAGMFLGWAIWAWFGFSYPSTLLPTALNVVSKILSFVTAITLFLPRKVTLSK